MAFAVLQLIFLYLKYKGDSSLVRDFNGLKWLGGGV